MVENLKVNFFAEIVEFRSTFFIEELLRLVFNCV